MAVEVLDDSHDDDGETFTLTLSNASGANAFVAHETATGTIRNSDPMPKAWITRFGRTVSDHVVDAIQDRLRDRRRESHFTLGGVRVDGLFDPLDPEAQDRFQGYGTPMPGLDAPMFGSDHGTPMSLGRGTLGQGTPMPLDGGMTPASMQSGYGREPPSMRDLLMGSSFFYSSLDDEEEADSDEGGLRDWAAWGNVASTRFSGQDGALSLDGEVSTATLGADAVWGRWLGGVVLARSEGVGGFRHETASGGEIASTLTSLHPFAQYEFNERTSVWGALGYGLGGLALTPEGADESVDTDLRMAMAAFGGRGVLSMRGGAAGSFELALLSDAMFTQTESGAQDNLLAATGATSRLRLMLEGSGSLPLGSGVLTPTMAAGLRYDGGDAETGAGLEIDGGLDYAFGRLTLQMNARMLAAHQDSAYEEWGFSGTLAWKPRTDGRGLGLSLGSVWGAAQSGIDSLWSNRTMQGLGGRGPADANQRYRAEVRYGLEGRSGRSLWAPFAGAEYSPAGNQSLRFGLKFNAGEKSETSLEFGRRQNAYGIAEDAVMLRGELRW